MCKWGTDKQVLVKIPTDLSSTGAVEWKYKKIDFCIADIVQALQRAGIDMRGSCCGHGKTYGHIHCQDGRILLLLQGKNADDYYTHRTRLFLSLFVRQLSWVSLRYPYRLIKDLLHYLRNTNDI